MNIIVATSDSETSSAIANQFTLLDIPAQLSVVSTTDDFIEELKRDKSDFIIADYIFDGSDIWQLAKLVNSVQLVNHALPLHLVEETCDTEIPMVLAKEYFFQVTPIQQLPHTLQESHQNNRIIGYSRGPAPTDKPSVLVIEDDDQAAEFVYLALKNTYNVEIACDGEEGLALWTKKRHNLVLLDYMLPGLKGDEVLNKIMEIDQNQPIIIMTAYDQPTFNRNFILNGASQYLPKPFTLDTIRNECQSIISKAKLIYQIHYTNTKLYNLSKLTNQLDHHINNNHIENAKRVMSLIKTILPNNLTDDDQLKWP